MATGLSRTGDGGVRCRTSPAQDRAIRRYGKQGATLKFKFYGNQLFKELDARSVGLFRRDPIPLEVPSKNPTGPMCQLLKLSYTDVTNVYVYFY
jgi:hypothetical protein